MIVDINLFNGEILILTDNAGVFTSIPKYLINISVTTASPNVMIITESTSYNVLYSDLNNPIVSDKNELAELINQYL